MDEFAGQAFAGEFVVDVGGDGDDDAVLLGHAEAFLGGAANVQIARLQRLGHSVDLDVERPEFVQLAHGRRRVQRGQRGGDLAHLAAEARAEGAVVGAHLVVHQFVLGGHAPQFLDVEFIEDVGLQRRHGVPIGVGGDPHQG